MDRQTGAGLQLDLSEAISFHEALRIHTIGGAYVTFDENELGSLKSGKKADFVVWNGNLETSAVASDSKEGRILSSDLSAFEEV